MPVQSLTLLRQVYTGQEERPNLPILNDNAPAPFDAEDDVVFICFDIETYERTPMLVTEVGFAILDTKDLRGIAPGRGAENWFKLIKGRHLRVEEYRHLRNGLYVEGWPDHFQFGCVVGCHVCRSVPVSC